MKMHKRHRLLKHKNKNVNRMHYEYYNFMYSKLHIFGLIGMVNHSDMQKIQIIGFFFENRIHWKFEIQLLLFTV